MKTDMPERRTQNVVDESSTFESGLEVVHDLTVIVPREIVAVCDDLQARFRGLEFSILGRGAWNGGSFTLSPLYAVPRQAVGGTSVDYDSDDVARLRGEGFDVVIHSHPFKSSSFSHGDDTTINSHFPVSILYSIGEFTAARVLLDVAEGLKISYPADIAIGSSITCVVPQGEVDKIEVKTSRVSAAYQPWERKRKRGERGEPPEFLFEKESGDRIASLYGGGYLYQDTLL